MFFFSPSTSASTEPSRLFWIQPFRPTLRPPRVAVPFADLLDPLVDVLLLPFHERLDRAVAVVLDPALQPHPPRHTCGEETVADALDFAVDTQMPLFLHGARLYRLG